jgi:phage terminase large subunit GpA-like protein
VSRPKHSVISEGIVGAIPDASVTVSQWAARNRFLPTSVALPGRWRNEVTPYLAEPMDCIGQAGVYEIVFVASVQVGKTELCNNGVAYFMHHDPSNIIYVAETDKKAEAWSKEKLAPMIRSTPVLRSLVRDHRERDSGNTVEAKSFPGGFLAIGYATSAETLSSRSSRVAFLDERDAYKRTKEGDPASLAEKRTITFKERRKVVKVSSPRERLEPPPGSPPDAQRFSPIEAEYEQSDKRKYWVPCPHCGTFQVLCWRRNAEGEDDEQGEYCIRWDEHEDGTPDLDNAYYVCVQGCVIEHDSKAEMLARGEWRAEKPFRGVAGFWIWAAYSPFLTWGQIAADFVSAKSDPEKLKTFVNTTLAKGWEDFRGEIMVSDLEERREPRTLFLPDGVLVLTGAADVQHNRLEYEVVGWGLDYESWSIDYGVIEGDPSQPEVWAQLKAALGRTFEYEALLGGVEQEDDESGAAAIQPMRVSVACIDSGGHHSEDVYHFCRDNAGRRWYPVKGWQVPGKPLVSQPSLLKRAGGVVRLYMVGTETAKDTLANRLLIPEPGPGFCHYPEEFERDGRIYYGADYFKQLRAEHAVIKRTKRGTARVWEKIKPHYRNEALDLRVYNMAALAILNPDLERLSTLRLSGKPLPQPPAEGQKRKSIVRSTGRGFVPPFSRGPFGRRF